MAHIVSSMEFFDSVMNALGIKDKLITGITIELKINDAVRVTIEKLINSDDSNRLKTIIDKYNLVKDKK